jgi:hypothetical protein
MTELFVAGVPPEFFLGGVWADPEAIHNLCLTLKTYIMKIML